MAGSFRLEGGRPDFREWVDEHIDSPDQRRLPLTHVTKGVSANDIGRARTINPSPDGVFDEPVAYFFYGRPAYRVTGDGSIRAEATCPFCFILEPALIDEARAIFALDTGAFANRMYKKYFSDEMSLEDFCLERDNSRPDKLIARIFGNKKSYILADVQNIPDADALSKVYQLHVRAYVNLLKSPGRNEPDDRICSIEVILNKKVDATEKMIAVVVPHTYCLQDQNPPWLDEMRQRGVEIIPYHFVPGRHPDYYYALIEAQVLDFYKSQGYL